MNRPVETVSIAIPVYNGERYLAEALQSVERQTVQPTEILLFDNASTDSTLEIAAAHLTQEQIRGADANRGAVWNFNRAVKESTGTYFAWLSSDDRLAPSYVEKCTAALAAEPDKTACLAGIRYIDLAGETLSVQTKDADLASTEAGTRLRSILRRNRWAEVYCLYRRRTLLASPIFLDEYGADVLLVWWLLLRGPFVVVAQPLYDYRIYPVKTVEQNAANLSPDSKSLQWRKVRMWCRLWQLSKDSDLPAHVTRAARLELLRCWASRAWVGHLYEDFRLQASAWRARLARRRT